jgi:hypothetical protein
MAISSPSAGRPGGVGGSPKKFPEKFSDNGVRDKHHRVSDVSVTSFWITSRRVAVHVFPGTRAQVYTRDATHRPTATLTPGRGAFLRSCSGKCRSGGGECREMSGFSEIFRNFRKKVKKSEKYPPPARAGGGYFGVFGDKFSGNLGKFHEISEKSHFSTPPRGGVKNPQIWPKNPPPGGG